MSHRSTMPTQLGRVPVQRRSMARVRLQAAVQFQASRISGAGALHDLSLSGARIRAATSLPPCWSSVRVELCTTCGVRLSIEATVTRHQDDGFAVMFRSLSPVAERVLRTLILHASPAE